MLGDVDPDSRFAYLLEPLGDVADETSEGVAPPAVVQPEAKNEWSGAATTRITLAAFLLVTMGVAAATIWVPRPRPEPSYTVDVPVAPAPQSTTAPAPTARPVPVSPPAATAPATERPATTAIVKPPPELQPTPATTGPAPEVPVRPSLGPPSPTTRSPISVQPEPHEPFPDQQPPNPGRSGGGLVPGVPGPLGYRP